MVIEILACQMHLLQVASDSFLGLHLLRPRDGKNTPDAQQKASSSIACEPTLTTDVAQTLV